MRAGRLCLHLGQPRPLAVPDPCSQARKRCPALAAGFVPHCHQGLSLARVIAPAARCSVRSGPTGWQRAGRCCLLEAGLALLQTAALFTVPAVSPGLPARASPAGCGPRPTTPAAPGAPGRDPRGGAAAAAEDPALHVATAPDTACRPSPADEALRGSTEAGWGAEGQGAKRLQGAGPRLSPAPGPAGSDLQIACPEAQRHSCPLGQTPYPRTDTQHTHSHTPHTDTHTP